MISGVQDIAFLAGILIGSLMLLSVCWVWIRKQMLGGGGIALSALGVTLVGLAVWSSVRIEASPDGLIAEFRQELQRLEESVQGVEENVQDVVDTNIRFTDDIQTLATSLTDSDLRVTALTRALQASDTINPGQLVQPQLAVPLEKVQQNLIRQRSILENIQKNSR